MPPLLLNTTPARTSDDSLFWISALILSTLAVMFAASCAMFYMLVQRWTAGRRWVMLSDWAKDHRMRFERHPEKVPTPLNEVKSLLPSLEVRISGKDAMLLRFATLTDAALSHKDRSSPDGRSTRRDPLTGGWNLLVCPLEHPWPPTGLRPVGAASSVVDLYALGSFPLIGNSERFVLFGTDTVAAAALSRSTARGLLPPDVGLLVYGRHLLLDFSARPFDEIEFERMMVVARQIASHLPIPDPGVPAHDGE